MFNSGILDVAIGLLLVFLLVSTVCTAVREGIESVLKTRAAYLEYAIRELLRDRDGGKLARSFYQHPLIFGLFQNDYKPGGKKLRLFAHGGSLPSYIPSRNFAATLIDIVASGRDLGAAPSGGPLRLESLRESVGQLKNPDVERVVLSAIDWAEGDLQRVRQYLEAWYDGTMDRVSGWYKRATQKIIFAIALVIVAALNVNAITIANTLYRDQVLRAAVVVAAENVTPDQGGAQHALATLDALQLPIGWHGQLGKWWDKVEQHRFDPLRDFVTPLFGLLLTAFAATLGAPFWFDVLNKVMVIRATVKPREKSQDEGSEDRSATQSNAPLSRVQPSIQIVTADPAAIARVLGAGVSSNETERNTGLG